ncbi:MAG: biotin--[acetyl-CoA-carboxylase] ligase [Verrucomicrobiota bacterium]|nr:biotin--[acetyl-CoA-carboxylase] ligase [Verrucomicrobiota bacterium]
MSRAEPRLEADALRAALRGRIIGREVLVLDETTSTNDFVFGTATPQTPEGLVVFAERQTAGRGQHGKRWESVAAKGLWFSVLLRPKILPEESPRLTTWAASTIAGTINDQFSLGATVKPPNDVYAGARKVAGVLLEMRAVPHAPHLGILGVGVNVNHAAEDFPDELRKRAGSIALALGHNVDRLQFARALLRNLDRTYRETFAS